jgi:hypothetical protein
VRALMADRPVYSSPPCLLQGVLPKNHQCSALCMDPLRALLLGASVRAYKPVGNLAPYLPPLPTPRIQCAAATQIPQPPTAVCASSQTAARRYRLVPVPVSSATQTQTSTPSRTISTQTPPARSYTIRILTHVQPLPLVRVLSPVTAVLPSPNVDSGPPLTLKVSVNPLAATLAFPSVVSPLAAPPSYSGGEERLRKVARLSCSHSSPYLPAPSARTLAVRARLTGRTLTSRPPQAKALVASHPLFSRRHWRSPLSSARVLSTPSASLSLA